jgi:class 3 adenylate cyclase
VARERTGNKTDVVADDLHPVPEIRVSDQDRERAVAQLRQNATDGSLTLDEFADRVGVALSARTRGELHSVLSDLPAVSVPDTRRGRARRWVVAVMSGSQAKGRWRVGGSVAAVAVMGGCELDFRRAEIAADEVHVTAVAVMGGIDIIVPEGIAVELTGLPIMGGKQMKVADVPILPGSPIISVRAFPIMGGVSVRSKSDRTTAKADPTRLERRGPEHPSIEPAGVEEGASGQSHGNAPSAPEGTVTIMFSDIAGYSEITERLGDLVAHDLLRVHNVIVREQLASHGGREVKAQGDGFMVAFPSATQALRSAVAIQKAFEKYCVEHPDEPIRVHLGLHTGEPVRDGNDLLGRPVITASRLSDIAGPGEILVSSLLHDLAESTGEFRFGDPRQVELKGITGAQTIYPVDWQS